MADTGTEPGHGIPFCSTTCGRCGDSFEGDHDTLYALKRRYGETLCPECAAEHPLA